MTRFLLAMALILVAGCGQPPSPPLLAKPTTTPIPTSAPPPSPTETPAAPDQAASMFLGSWQQGNYAAMYELLSGEARAATARDVFIRRYSSIHSGLGETGLAVQAQPAQDVTGQRATVPFRVTRSVAIFGDLTETNELPLVFEQNRWAVVWTPSLIFKQLTAASTVRPTTATPKRGSILDRHGKALAEDGQILAVGVIPGQIKDEAQLQKALSDALGLTPEQVVQRYQGGQPDWFMPMAKRPESDRPNLEAALGAVPGVALQDQVGRVYPLGDAAAHVVGYVSKVSADDLQRLAQVGYDESDVVGRTGIEAWGEQSLAGTKGGKIVILDEAGALVRTIAQKAAVPGSDIQLTLDAELQAQAADALGEKTGSVVVLDPRDNSIRVLASRPSFDPNQLVIGLSDAEWQQLNAPPNPLIFRAASTGYPTGSTFKVITMAAGLEKGGVKATDKFDCGLDWHGLPGVTLHNWQQEGTLDLVESLSESCNPTFYTIGQKLDGIDPDILPTFARAFGLGQPTGVIGVREDPGLVPDAAWKQAKVGEPWTTGDSVNLAIGQGYLLATPLQLANAYSALANGGTLRTPLLVTSVKRADGTQQDGDKTFSAQGRGELPLSAANLNLIVAGMKRVTSTAQGTASSAFRGEKLPIAAKTGSAENENPDAHAWFVGYMTPDQPSTLAVVMVEGGQHGGTVAAPLAREILDFDYPRIP